MRRGRYGALLALALLAVVVVIMGLAADSQSWQLLLQEHFRNSPLRQGNNPVELPQASGANSRGTLHLTTARIVSAKDVLPASAFDLPIANEVRPDWLLRGDILVVDVPEQRRSGMLIVQAVLSDAQGLWGNGGRQQKARRPQWLRACLAANWQHALHHGHAMVLRHQATRPMLTPWERDICVKDSGGKPLDESDCERRWERENFNWEKHLQLNEYLRNEKRKFTHVLMLDADATFSQVKRNTLQQMAQTLQGAARELFVASEDWLVSGEQRINGGLIFAKNSAFTRNLFQDTVEAHWIGPGRGDRGLERWRIGIRDRRCGGNDQACLNSIFGLSEFADHTLLASGLRYNRGGCLLGSCGERTNDPPHKAMGLADPNLDVIHFMGGSKPMARDVLCNAASDWGEVQKRYGCEA